MKANIKKISELTGFSPATVSNALNNKRGVNKETAEKIRQTAREIGYLAEWHVSSIKLVMYRASGAIVNDSPFFSSLVAGVEAEARNFGFDTLVCNLYGGAGQRPLQRPADFGHRAGQPRGGPLPGGAGAGGYVGQLV